MNILAGHAVDYRYDAEAKEFKPAATVADGPTFTVRCLDYWQAQAVLDQSTDAVKRIRLALETGLASIDGDAAKVKEFLDHPRATLVNPLFDAILQLASGN